MANLIVHYISLADDKKNEIIKIKWLICYLQTCIYSVNYGSVNLHDLTKIGEIITIKTADPLHSGSIFG